MNRDHMSGSAFGHVTWDGPIDPSVPEMPTALKPVLAALVYAAMLAHFGSPVISLALSQIMAQHYGWVPTAHARSQR